MGTGANGDGYVFGAVSSRLLGIVPTNESVLLGAFRVVREECAVPRSDDDLHALARVSAWHIFGPWPSLDAVQQGLDG